MGGVVMTKSFPLGHRFATKLMAVALLHFSN
jgi:hypothetical protein